MDGAGSWLEPWHLWHHDHLVYCLHLSIPYSSDPLKCHFIHAAGCIHGRSSADLRAGFWRKWTAVLLPLLLPGILTGGMLVFLTALTELTVSALLYSSGSQTIGVTIFSFEQAGDTLYSTALSSLIVALIAAGGVILLIAQRWATRKGVKS